MIDDRILLLLLGVPFAIGAILAAVNADSLNRSTELAEASLRRRQQRASATAGRLTRLLINPILWLLVKFCDVTDRLAHRGLKNGVRVAGALYLLSVWLLVVYVAAMIAIAAALMALVLWITFKVLGSSTDGKGGTPERERSDRECRVYRGSSTWGAPILTVQGSQVYLGSSTWGAPLYTIDGERIYKGSSTWGAPVATLDGQRVYQGSSTWGAPLATIEGNLVYEGSSTWGAPLATFEGEAPMTGAAAAVFLLP